MDDSPPPRRTGSVRLDFAPSEVAVAVSPLPPLLTRRWSDKGGAGGARAVTASSATRSTHAKQAAAEARRQVRELRGREGRGVEGWGAHTL